MTEELEQYILRHIDAEPEHLARLDRDTHLQLLYPHMCSGHLQGRLLKMLVRMVRPRRVLEIGTYSGYSAQCLAEGLVEPGAVVHTVDIDDEIEDFVVRHLEHSPVAGRIQSRRVYRGRQHAVGRQGGRARLRQRACGRTDRGH